LISNIITPPPDGSPSYLKRVYAPWVGWGELIKNPQPIERSGVKRQISEIRISPKPFPTKGGENSESGRSPGLRVVLIPTPSHPV